MYILYIETHTHDHTFSLSAHAPTRVSRAPGIAGFSEGPRRYRRAESPEMARSAGKNKKREESRDAV